MNLLSIGGSDPSSGAGIQSDIKTFDSLNVYGVTAITAITSQNTSSFGIIEPISKKILKSQIDSIFSDFIHILNDDQIFIYYKINKPFDVNLVSQVNSLKVW